jgi:nitroimidazol reductase NimA-like FMN-containing flavoprotein (pyridoxamine 5'-phosphate oxidase superfamily)
VRRSELQCDDPAEVEAVLAVGEVGYLGLVDALGYPRVVPLNFVFTDGRVYFHGAREGEKFTLFESDPKVTFAVAGPHTVVPSYWFASESACPATALFKSVHLRGRGTIVTDTQEKADALQRLMEKYQPEGGHQPITATEEPNRSVLQHTGVFRIDPVQIDLKIKLAQALGAAKRRDLIARLEERNRGQDREVAEAMRTALNGARL